MSDERSFHHAELPGFSTLLTGREPRDQLGWPSDRLQIWFNNTSEPWVDEVSHAHSDSDEVFIVLEGVVVVEVDGSRVEVGPGEFCCFPTGLNHQIVETRPPLKTFMLRGPSIQDKI